MAGEINYRIETRNEIRINFNTVYNFVYQKKNI